MLSVPTPVTSENRVNLTYVRAVTESILTVIKRGDTIILESTVPVGTTAALAERVAKATGLVAGKDFFVAHCPERVMPGNIFHELQHNDRMIGGVNEVSSRHAADFYRPFVVGELHITDDRSAEMVKLVENSYRDVNIAFAHQVASMAESAGIDPYHVIAMANKHPRVNILKPTAGVGGHCIAVDPWFLVESFPNDTALLKAARMVNNARPHQIVSQINRAVQQSCQEKPTVLLAGLAYKPNVDDLRESPAIVIAKELLKRNDINVMVCEPYVGVAEIKHKLGVPTEASLFVVSFEDGVARADIVALLVGHTQFASHHAALMTHGAVVDACGLLRSVEWRGIQFKAAEKIVS